LAESFDAALVVGFALIDQRYQRTRIDERQDSASVAAFSKGLGKRFACSARSSTARVHDTDDVGKT
jgi:hypothetical protein